MKISMKLYPAIEHSPCDIPIESFSEIKEIFFRQKEGEKCLELKGNQDNVKLYTNYYGVMVKSGVRASGGFPV